jgi:two-component system catabolic regulation response regulator CreB
VPHKILIIEDEPAIADTLLYALKTEGFEPHWCATGQAGVAALSVQPFALVVLDIGLPDGSGFEFCKSIRTQSDVPIIFLTARAAEIDRVVGLEIGGDDYLVKPFSPRELTARVKAILRRTNGHGATPHVSSGPQIAQPTPIASPSQTSTEAIGRHSANLKSETSAFALDEARCQIAYRSQLLDLTRYEFRLLRALLAQPGRVFSRDQLMNAAWEEPAASLDRTVDAHIKTLRAKLRAIDKTTDPIQTHRGLGYSLRE